MQKYDYFDILDFKDQSDRDRIAIRNKTDHDLGVGSRSLFKGSRSEKNGSRSRRKDRDRIDLFFLKNEFFDTKTYIILFMVLEKALFSLYDYFIKS